MPRDRPRATDFAAEPAEGDVFQPESVSIEGPRGRSARQVARSGPRETPEAAERAEGEFPGVEGFAFGALRDMHGMGRAEGDAPRADSVALGASHGSRTRSMPRNRPRETDFAAGRAKGDVSGPKPVALAASRGSPHPPNPTKPEGGPG